MQCTVATGSDGVIYIQSFTKIGRGVEAILSFCLVMLQCCKVGIRVGRDI
jgi:hypothetical protein